MKQKKEAVKVTMRPATGYMQAKPSSSDATVEQIHAAVRRVFVAEQRWKSALKSYPIEPTDDLARECVWAWKEMRASIDAVVALQVSATTISTQWTYHGWPDTVSLPDSVTK